MRSFTAKKPSGFTLIELLVVVAIIGILAGLLLPVLARSKAQAQGVYCINNLRELSLGWLMYADDAHGNLAYNMGGQAARTNLNWVADLLDWTTNPDNTNTLELTGAALGPYVNRSTLIYHCPADKILAPAQSAEGWAMRARTYSMNASIGNAGTITSSGVNTNNPGYVQFFKSSSIPHPSSIFVFIEEHPNTISDGYFVNRIDYYYKEWLRLPAHYHNRTSAVSFADGHAEFHKWQFRSSLPTTVPYALQIPVAVPGNQTGDFDWIAHHMSVETP